MKSNTAPTTGMRDSLPEEVVIRDYVLNKILEAYSEAGYQRIETPIVEHLSLLSSGEGGEDEKLIFKVLKRGDKLKRALSKDYIMDNDLTDSALRYDLTVPLTRFFAKNRNLLPKPFKVIQAGPVFRADRPQKGRYRQFMQCDIDITDAEEVVSEIDLLISSANALKNINMKGFFFRINDRRILSAMVSYCGFKEEDKSSVYISLDKLDKIGFAGVEKELLNNNFDNQAVSKIIILLKELSEKEDSFEYLKELLKDTLDSKLLEGFEKILTVINGIGGDDYCVKFQPTLVRGQGYYTGTIFEIAYKDYPSAFGGGGRYDKMIGKYLKEDVSACGISIGFERIVNLMADENLLGSFKKPRVSLLYSDIDNLENVYKKATELREKNIVSLTKKAKKLGKQLKNLKSFGFDHFYIFGEDELKDLT